MGYIVCSKCNTEKHRDEYYNHTEKKNGKMAFCKVCHNERTGQRAKLNKDKINQYNKIKATNKIPDQICEQTCKKCHNTKSISEFSLNRYRKTGYNSTCTKCLYEISDKEKRKERDLKNKEKVREINRRATKKYKLTHPEVKREDRKRRRRVKPDAETKDFLLMLSKDPCSYCGSYNNPSIDHIVPL